MKELKIEIPEGYEIDREKASFEKIVFKKKVEVNCWEDLKRVTGVYITDSNCIVPAAVGLVKLHNQNVFLNEKYAKSALALAQISQLLPYYDTDVYWKNNDFKYCIIRTGKDIIIDKRRYLYHVLAFNSLSEAKRFLEHNEQLVKDYYML